MHSRVDRPGGDHVLGDQDPAARRDLEAAPQREAAIDPLDEDRGAAELARRARSRGRFRPAPARRRGRRPPAPPAARAGDTSRAARAGSIRHAGALQIERAVKARGQDEMTRQKCACSAELGQDLGLADIAHRLIRDCARPTVTQLVARKRRLHALELLDRADLDIEQQLVDVGRAAADLEVDDVGRPACRPRC